MKKEKVTADTRARVTRTHAPITPMKNGWLVKELSEVCNISGGGTPSKAIKRYWEGTIPWVSSKDMKVEELFDSQDHISEEAVANSATSIIPKESVLIVVRSGILIHKVPLAINIVPVTINQDMKAFLPKREIFFRYLFYYLKGNHQKLLSYASRGATVHRIPAAFLEEFPIYFPVSLDEQKRIVAILDEAFAAIDKARENAEKNLANAREVFESYLNGVFSNPGKGWEEKRLGAVSRINYGYTEKASFTENGPKFLRITDIQNNHVDWATVPFCKCDESETAKYKLKNGDIVFARTGATTGKSYLVTDPPKAIFASYLIRVQIEDTNTLFPSFLYSFFQTKQYWEKITISSSGSAQGGFNASKLGEMSVPIPPLSEQKYIVAKLTSFSAETKHLDEIYCKKIAALEELKKSILDKAFKGEY